MTSAFSWQNCISLCPAQIVIINYHYTTKKPSSCFALKKNNFIYLFLTDLGLHCCAWAFSSCGCSSLWCVGLSLWWLLAEHRLQAGGVRSCSMWLSSCSSWAVEHRLSSCGPWAQSPLGMWDLPRSGVRFMSPATAGRFFTTEPPGEPPLSL